MMQAGLSGGVNLPSLEYESVTLQSHDGKGLGFDVSANADGGFTVQDVQGDGAAGASGKIKAGDRITGIAIDMDKLRTDDARKLLNALAPFPVKFNIKKEAAGGAGLGAGLKIDAPKLDFGVNGAKADVTVPGNGTDVGFTANAPKFEAGATVGLPGIGVEVDGSSKGGIDIDLPDVEIDPGSIELPGGKGGSFGNKLKGFFSPGNGKKDKHSKGKAKLEADVSLPNIEFEPGKVEGNIEGGFKPGDIDVTVGKPNVSVDLGGPNIEGDLKVKQPKAERESWFEKHRPKIGLGKSGKYSVADASANIDVEAPSVDIKAPKPDVKGNVELKGKLPKAEFHAPGISGELSGSPDAAGIKFQPPTVGIDVQKPDIDTSVDVNLGLPKAKAEATIPEKSGSIAVTGPSVDVTLPEVDVDTSGPSIGGKIKGFFKRGDSKKKNKGKPDDTGGIKLGFEAEGPKVDYDISTDVNLPKGDVDIHGPRLSGSVGGDGGVGFDVKGKGPSGGIAFGAEGQASPELPELGVDLDRGQLHDANINAPKGKVGGGLHFGLPKFGTKGKGPKGELDAGGSIEGKVEGELPDVDVSIDKPKGSGGFNIGFPKIGFKGKGPKGELDIEGDASLPSGGIEGKVEGELPDVDVDVKKPKGSGGIHFGLPSFGLKGKGPKGELDVEGDASLPSGGFEGKVEGELPDVDVDVKKPKGSGGIHFGLPSFGIKGKGPKGELDVEGDASLPSGGIEGKVEGELPDVDVDLKKPTASGGIHFGLPSFGFKGKGPKGELDVEGDASLPSGGFEGKVEGELPDVDVDVKKPKGSGGIHFGLPSFGIKGKGPKGDLDAGGDVGLPSGSIGGKVEGELPDVDVSVDKPKGSGGFNIGFPNIGFKGKGPKGELDIEGDVSHPSGGIDGKIQGELPDVDVDLKKPKGSGGIHFGLPSFGLKGKGPKGELDVEGDASLPSGGFEGKVEGELPDVDVDLKKPKGSGGIHFGLPSFGLKGKGPKGELDVEGDASLPSGGLEGKVEGELPDVDVDLKKPKGSGGIHFGLPSFGIKGKGPKGELDAGGDVNLPSGSIGGRVEGELPDVDVNIDKPKGSGGFNIGFPKIGLKGKGPKGELDVEGDASLPSGGIEGKIEGELPDVDVDLKKPKGSGGIHFGLPSFGIKGKGAKGDLEAGGDVNLPSGSIGGKVEGDLPDVDVDLKKPKGSGGIHFGLPSFGFKGKGPKGELDVEGDASLPSGGIEGKVEGELPDVDVDLKKPKASGGIHFGLPSFGLKGKGPKGELDVEGDASLPSGGFEGKVEGELPDVDVDVKKPKGSGGIHFGLPSFGLKGKGPKGELDAGADVSLPSGSIGGKVEGDLPDVDVNVDKPKGSGGFHIGLPSFGFKGKGPKGELDVEGDASLPSGGIEGKVEGELPDVDVDLKKPKASGGIHFGLPSFGLKGKGPKGELDVEGDASLPSGGFEGKVEGELPDVDVDLKKPKGSGGIHFGLPSIGFKGKGPKGELDAGGDVSLPSGSIGGKVEGELPDVDVNVDKPKGGGGFHIGLPSFGFKGKGPKGELDVEGDASLPSGGIEGKVEGELPDVDVDVKKPKGSGGIHFGLPSFGLKGKGPKGELDAGADVSLPSGSIGGKVEGELPDVDVNVDKPKGSGGFNIGFPKIGFKGKGPKGELDVDGDASLPSGGYEGKIEGELPDVDMDVKKPKGSGGIHFGLPSIGFKGKGPKGELDTGGDISLPEGGIEGKVEGELPDVDISVDKPKGGGGFSIGLPSIGMKGKGKKGKADVTADVSLPSGGVEGNVEGQLPDVDISAEKPKGKGGFHIGFPKFGGKGKAPKGDVDVNVESSLPSPGIKGKFEGDLPEVDVNVDVPKFAIEGGADINSPEGLDLDRGALHDAGKGKGSGGFHFGLPKFGSKGKSPKVDAGANVDVKLPSGGIEGKVEGELPDVEVSAKKPKGSGGFSFGRPKFGRGKSAKGDIDADVSLPSGGIEGKVGVDIPDVEIKADKPKGTAGINVDLPSIGIKGKAPKVDIDTGAEATLPSGGITVEGGLPDAEVNIKKPKGSGGFSFGLPKFGIKGKGPKGDIDVGADASLPSGKIEGQIEGNLGDANVSVDKPKASGGIHIGMPSFGGSLPSGKIEGKVEGDLPEVDVSVDKPKTSGGFHLGMPSLDLKGKGPKGDIDIGADASLPVGKIEGNVEGNLPGLDVNVDKPKGSGGFHMPSFGFKGKGPKGDIDIGADASLPSGKIEGKVEGDLPDVDISMDKPKGSGGFHMPSFGFKGKGPKGDIDIGADASLPSGKIEGKVEGDLPDVDISVDKPKGSGGFHMPSFGFKGKGPKGDIDIGADASLPSGKIEGKVEGDLPDVDISVDKPKGSGGFHMPSFGFKGKGPKGDIDIGADASLPSGKIEGKVEGDLPDVDINVDKPKGSGGFHMPSFGFKGKGPKGDIDIGADASLPSGKIEGKVEGDLPDVDISMDKTKGSGGFHMPTFGFKGKGPKGDIDVGADASLPYGKIEGKVEGDLPDVDVSVDKPKGSGGFNIGLPKLGFAGKGPKGEFDVEGDASLPSGGFEGKVEGELPDVDVDVKKPKGSGGLHFGLPSIGFKGKGPKGDIDIGADASLPSGKIEGKVEGGLPDVDVSVEKPKGSGGFHIDMPKFGFGHKDKGPKGDIDLGADASLPSGKLEGKIEGELPDADLNLEKPKGSGGIHIGMPSVNIKGKSPKGDLDIGDVSLTTGGLEGNVAGELPEADFDVKKPKGSGGFSIGLPKFGITGKGPKGDIDAGGQVGVEGSVDADLPDVDVHLDKPKVSGGIHIGKPSFGFKGKGPKVDTDVGAGASLPSGSVEGNIEAAVPEVDIETKKPKGSSSGGIHFGLPRLSFKGKSPKAEVQAGDKSLSGGVEGSLKSPGSPDADINVDVKGPSVDIDAPDLKAGKKGFGNKMKGFFSGGGKKNGKGKTKGGISVGLPDVDLNVSGPQVSVEGTGDLGKVKGPEVNIEAELPKLDLKGKGPEVDIQGEGKIGLPEISGDRGALHDADVSKGKAGGGIHFGLPKFKGKAPKADLDASANASLPLGNLKGKVEGDLPDVDANVNMPKGGIQIGMPSLDFKGKGPKGDIDIGADASLPTGKIQGKVEGDLPDVDINVDKPKGSGGFHMPTFGFKGKGPKGDIDIGAEASLPSGKVEGKVEGDLPGVDINVDKPKGSGGFHIGLPKLGFTGKGPKGEFDVEGDASLPSGGFEGKVEGDLPDIDVDVKKPKGSGGIHFGLPSLGFKGKGPKGELDAGGDVSLPSGSIGGTVEGDLPDIDVNVDKPKGSGGFNVGFPKIGFKGKGPKGDLDVEGDASLPSVGFEGKVEGELPDVDVDVKKPKGSGGIHFGLPSIGLKGKGPKGDIDIGADASLPSGKIEGKVEGGLPDVDVSVDKPKGSGGFHIDMPKFGFGHKDKGPKGDIDLGADASLPSGKLEGKIEGELPGVDVSVDKPKASGGVHFGMPSLGFKGKAPEGDIDIGADASLPSGKIEGKVEGGIPDVDVSVDKPKGGGGFHIDMPKFGFGHKGKGPKGDIDLGADASLPSGKLEGKIEGELPDVNIDKPKASGGIHVGLPSLSLEGKGPKGNVDIGTSLPSGTVEGKLHSPDVDIGVDKPKASGGFHFGLPKIGMKSKGSKGEIDLSGDASLPSGGIEGKVEGELPDAEVNVKKPKGSGGFHIGMPKFGMKGKAPEASADLKVEAPTVDVNIPSSGIGIDASVQGPKVEKEGQVKVKMPKFGAEAGAEHPGVDASVSFEGPEVDLESPNVKASKKGDFGGKMKRLFSGSGKKKGKGELKGDLSIESPSADVNISGPDVSFEGKGEVPGINVDAETPKGSSGLKFNLPKFGAHVKAPEVEAGVDASLKAPKGSIEGGVHADAPDVSLGTSKGSGSGGFHVGFPKLGSKGGKAEVDASLGSVEVEADVPQAKLEGDKSKSGGNFQLGLPKFGINWQGSKEAGEVGTTGGIEGQLSADVGSANLEAGKLAGTAEVPSYGFQGSIPQTGIEVKSPKLESDIGLSVDAPKGRISGELPSADIQFGKPKGSGEVGLQGPSAGVSFDAPKTTVSGSLDLESPSVQIERPDSKRGSLGRKVKGFFSSKDRSSSPKADVDVSLGGGEGSSVDKPGFSAGGGVKVTPPAVQVDVKKAKEAEFGFATSYDAGLHREAAVDVQSPSISIGGEAECGSPSSDNERSMLHDEKSHKFQLKLGGKSSKSKAEKKKRPRIEEGLRSGLATELLVSGGYVQLSDDDKNRKKDESRTDDKKKSSQSEA